MATEQDFDDLVENPSVGSGVALSAPGGAGQWPKLVRILKDMKALWKSRTVSGGNLTALQLGSAVQYNRVRVSAFGLGIRLQTNTGTEGAPVWTDMLLLDPTSGLAILNSHLVIPAHEILNVLKATFTGSGGVAIDAGNQKIINVSEIEAAIVKVLNSLDMGGFPITNAGAITATAYNGFTLGGSVAPQPVGASNTPGVNATFARTDHAHRGVQEVDVDGAGDLAGVLNLVSFDRIAVTRSGQDVRFAWQPREQYADNTSGADQGGIAGNTETNVTALTGIAITGADGARTFRVSGQVTVQCSGGSSLVGIYVYVGANGNLSDGGAARVAAAWTHTDGGLRTLQIPEREFVPAVGARIGVAVIFTNAAVTGTVKRVAPDQGHLALLHV